MNILKKFYCRTYQIVFRAILPFLPYRQPQILEDNNEVIEALKSNKKTSVFFVTDKNIRGLKLTNALETALVENNFNLFVFDNVMPNPTVSAIEDATKEYLNHNCDCIIACGGGSVIDLAKIVGARVVKPNKSVIQMKGLLKIRKKLPTFIAIPTTAGTGSETTLAAVITDDKTHYKYTINDFSLIPHYALLDYNLTIGLNPFITSTTGMDALTHAIEAYIGRSTTKKTRQASLTAIKLIKENLVEAFNNGLNKKARQNMLKASFLAGVAFTQSYVGYVHAIAHSLGGKYGVPHGLANAIILPLMLKEYGKSAEKKLNKIALYIGISNKSDSACVGANKLISWIEDLNKKFNIPNFVEQLNKEDILDLATKANSEANPLYPVPKLMDTNELSNFYLKLIKH